MYTEVMKNADISILSQAVDEFTNDKILLDVRIENIGGTWYAYICYIPLF